jgi:hypothetical protein
MPAPDKQTQERESADRAKAGVVPGEGGEALNAIDDGAPGADPAPAARQAPAAEPAPKPAPVPRSRQDDARNAITARFRTDRGQEAADNADDVSEFTRSGMPPEFAENNAAVAEPPPQEPEPAAPEPTAAEPVALPKTVKVKVRGQEQELPLETVIAEAQKALAGESYLSEGRKALEEIERRLRATPDPAVRGQTQQHPAATNDVQPTAPAPADGVDPQHPEDLIQKLMETMQFGDPAEARNLLENTLSGMVAAKVAPAVNAALQSDRLKDEGAKTAAVLADFETKHADIAADPRARAVIEQDVIGQQVDDLRKLGVDPAKIRPDGLSPTPGDIAEAHKWYRSQGHKLTTPADMLETGLKNYLDWRGPKTNTPPANPATPPTLDVTVDRTVRRQAIPQQPGRAAVPRQDPQRSQPAPARDRSRIVQDEIARRNAPRGKVAVS